MTCTRRFSATLLIVMAACIVCVATTRASEAAKHCACNKKESHKLVSSALVQSNSDASRRGGVLSIARLVLIGKVTPADLICASASYTPIRKMEVATGLAVAQVKLGRTGKSMILPSQGASDTAQSILGLIKNCADETFVRSFRERIVEERYDGNWGKDKGGDCRGPPCTAG